VGIVACGTANPAPADAVQLNEHQVIAIVEDMMNGYNQVDYSAFSKNLTAAMKLVVSEGLFKDFCAGSVDTLGQFQSVSNIAQIESNSHSTTWSITAQFEKASLPFNMTIRNSDGKVEGMDLGPEH
jgi:hypothetical protein